MTTAQDTKQDRINVLIAELASLSSETDKDTITAQLRTAMSINVRYTDFTMVFNKRASDKQADEIINSDKFTAIREQAARYRRNLKES